MMRAQNRTRQGVLVFLGIICFLLGGNGEPKNYSMAALRAEMVQTQLRERGITSESVLDAFNKVERHLFVPKAYRDLAYTDQPLPIGWDQTISQPYVVALMTELLELRQSDKVLEIGTGSGYQAAILAELVDSVFTIEIIDSLAQQAAARLDTLGYANVSVRSGDGYRGWPEHAPFDAIIVTCAPDAIPNPLIAQMAEGGRMVVPVGGAVQELVLLTKKDNIFKQRSVTAVRFVPMTGEAEDSL